jgi:hypothetical protein
MEEESIQQQRVKSHMLQGLAMMMQEELKAQGMELLSLDQSREMLRLVDT